MKKLFFFLAAMLVTLAVNATQTTLGSDNPKEVHEGVLKPAVASYDTIYLRPGIYKITDRLTLNKKCLIKALGDTVIVKPYKDNQIKSGADACFEGIFFDGSEMRSGDKGFDNEGDANDGKKIRFESCEFYGFSNIIIWGYNNCTLDTLYINNCYFHNNKKQLIYFDKGAIEGKQPINGLIVKNSTFANTDPQTDWRSIIDIRPYNEVQTGAIKVVVDHCTFYNNPTVDSGHANIRPYKLTDVKITNCIFALKEELDLCATYCNVSGGIIEKCIAFNYGHNKTDNYGHAWGATVKNCSIEDPQFTDAKNADFTLNLESPAINAGTDGKTLGDSRWWPVISYTETDFSGDGYVCSATNATAIDASIDVNTHYGEDKPYLRYTGSTNTYAEVTWKIQATRACFVNVKVNLADNSWNEAVDSKYQNGKHIFGVEILDEDGQRIDTVAEGVYGNGKLDGYGTYPQVDLGTLAVPEAGVYTIKLLNPRGWSKCGVNNVTLKYESDLPTAAAKGGWDSWANELAFTLAKDGKTATAKKTFNKGNEFEFKMLINGSTDDNWRANGWWFKRDATTATGITGNGNNMKIIADYTGEYTFTWTFETNSLAVTFPEPTLANGWYLLGTFNGVNEWTVAELTAAKKFGVNPDDDGEFVIITDLKVGDRFKAAYVYLDEIQSDSYKPAEGEGYVVTAEADIAGNGKSIYFRVEYYNTWGGHFYIKPNSTTAVDNTAVEGKAVKSIVNGQLIITRDGKTYNVLGTIVK